MDDKVYDEVRVCELVTSWLGDVQPLRKTLLPGPPPSLFFASVNSKKLHPKMEIVAFPFWRKLQAARKNRTGISRLQAISPMQIESIVLPVPVPPYMMTFLCSRRNWSINCIMKLIVQKQTSEFSC